MSIPTVLVVDDPLVRKLLTRRLQLDGHGVLAAASGAETLGTLKREPVDLVLLDVLMPPRASARHRAVVAPARQVADTRHRVRDVTHRGTVRTPDRPRSGPWPHDRSGRR